MRRVTKVSAFGQLACGLCALLAAATGWSTGRTPSSFAVSATGEAQYSIPIFAPPGVNGLAPGLALTYGHRNEGTLAGVGWGISGLSAIYRCEKTWAQNNEATAPQNALDDRYCLDGNQLRRFSGTYGTNGSTYRTEVETYARITAQGLAGNGPASFKVERKDGLIYDYGTTPDSQILSIGQAEARAWAVSRISDRSGNEITVTWYDDTANGSYRIYGPPGELPGGSSALGTESISTPISAKAPAFTRSALAADRTARRIRSSGSPMRRWRPWRCASCAPCVAPRTTCRGSGGCRRWKISGRMPKG